MMRKELLLHVLHDDADIVVVEKPGGLLAVPGRGEGKQDCVENRVRQLFPGCISQPAVHRLDMYTSGLMVLALTREAHRHLSKQFAAQRVRKRYRAVLDGLVEGESGEIELAFRLDPDNRPYQVYDPVQGKTGKSLWRKIKVEGDRTWVEFIPLTGRTHQLRLHASHHLGLNCPIVGDRLYGRGKEGGQMLLHATFLSFIHPATNEEISFTSPEPF